MSHIGPSIKEYAESMDAHQIRAIDLIKAGKNIFITGGAGSGKSYLINYIYRSLGIHKKITITSLTGISALLIGGTTIHSFSGIYQVDPSNPPEKYYDSMKKRFPTIKRIRATELLIVDEVSMMDYYMLDVLDYIFKQVKSSPRIFGGIQTVFVGDFFQLPPVSTSDSPNKYAFQNPLWNKLIAETIVLEKIHRQSESEFIKILNMIRVGIIDKTVSNFLERFMINEDDAHSKELEDYPKLYSRRRDNEIYNNRRLLELDGDTITYKARIYDSSMNVIEDVSKITFPNNLNVEQQIHTKIGAVIMVCYNVNKERGIVNGSIGRIVSYQNKADRPESTKYPLVRLTNGELYLAEPMDFATDKYIIKQLPIRLAWSLTIHKSQGASIDKVCVDIGSSIFEYGQAYVALSRCTNTTHLKIMKMNLKSIKADPLVLEFYKSFNRDITSFLSKTPKEEIKEKITDSEWEEIEMMVKQIKHRGEIMILSESYDIDSEFKVFKLDTDKYVGKLEYNPEASVMMLVK